MSAQLKVLHVASWYPSEVHPSLGNFIERHVEAVATACGGSLGARAGARIGRQRGEDA